MCRLVGLWCWQCWLYDFISTVPAFLEYISTERSTVNIEEMKRKYKLATTFSTLDTRHEHSNAGNSPLDHWLSNNLSHSRDGLLFSRSLPPIPSVAQ